MTFCAICSIVLKTMYRIEYAPVAQGIEQWFPVPRVGGSNPSRCADVTNEKIRTEEK